MEAIMKYLGYFYDINGKLKEVS